MKTFEVEMLKIEKERNEMKKETLEIRKKGRMPKDGSLSIGNEGEK